MSNSEFSMLEKAISDMDGYQCVGELQYYGDAEDYLASRKKNRPQSTKAK